MLQVAGATDYRLRQLTQAGTYLMAQAADSGARLEALFRELSDAGTQAGGAIEIEGRPIPVVRAAHGAVWFDFRALCAGPRSQEDYIEIAREYQSVIVSDVPVLDAALEDEARRFIALVDELYDRNVNLIVSAAAAPARALRRQPAARALRAHRQPPDRDAERGLPGARTPCLRWPKAGPLRSPRAGSDPARSTRTGRGNCPRRSPHCPCAG